LKLDTVFIIKATINTMKFSKTKSACMTAIKREWTVLAKVCIGAFWHGDDSIQN
jgi:hypothetical protein